MTTHLNPLLALALMLLASIAVNAGLIIWMAVRGAGPRRILDVWTGRGWDPVKLKPGQDKHTYKRPGGGSIIFKLDEEWAQPYGKRGLKWMGNAMNGGDMYRFSTEKKAWVAVVPAPGEAMAWRELKEGEDAPEEEGSLLQVKWPTRPMTPSGDYLATALDDGREVNWFKGHKQADQNNLPVKPNWLLIAGAAVAVWFFFMRGH